MYIHIYINMYRYICKLITRGCVHIYIYIYTYIFIYVYIYIYIYIYIYASLLAEDRRKFCRTVETVEIHQKFSVVSFSDSQQRNRVWRGVLGCLIFIGHFLQKSPIISGSFAKNDLQLKASYEASPPCTTTQPRGGLSLKSYNRYGAASISRLLKIIGLFCKRAI